VLLRWSKELIPIRKRGAIWIMVGRPRKSGKRERNGRIARTYENPKAQVASQPHRRGVVVNLREREEAESEFGRLMLRGGITPAHFEAGIAFIRLCESVRQVYDAASPNPPAMDLNRRAGFPGPGMTSAEGQAIKDKYMRVFDCAGEAGSKAQRTLAPHVIRDEPVTDLQTLEWLKAALDRLVRFFGIDPKLKLSRGRNIS
jgi:hypothetical protein